MRPSVRAALPLLLLLAPSLLPSGAAAARDVSADKLLAKLAARGKKTRALRGRFEQTKKVALFRAVVKSSGRFVVRRDVASLTLRWVTEKPAPSELRFDGHKVEMRAPGSTTRRVDVARAPRFGRLVRDLVAFLGAGGTKALRARYTITASGKKLVLVPKGAALSKRIARVELQLGDTLETEGVRIVERGGDRTDIRLKITQRR